MKVETDVDRRISRLCRELERTVRGDVDASPHKTAYYSADASAYQIKPDVIVTPEDEQDVADTVRIAARTQTPITARGGGTGLVGGALNCGIILEMRKISGVNQQQQQQQATRDKDSNTITIGAGMSAGELDHMLGMQDEPAMFAPNPSVGPFCTIGGMIANNAAGSRSLKYGCTIDNVQGMTIIDGTGRTVTLSGANYDDDDDDRNDGRQDDAAVHGTEMARKIFGIASGADKTRFPRVSKNASGYRLDAVMSVEDAHKALVGSEGTLGVIVSARLRTVKRPSSRVLYVLEYRTYRDAAADCTRITARRPVQQSLPAPGAVPHPAAAEFVDEAVISNMSYGFGHDTACLLLVEYDDNISSRMYTAGSTHVPYHPAESQMALASPMASRRTCIRDEAEISRMWRHRNASLHYSITGIDRDAEERVPHVIEDAAVPPGSLCMLFDAMRVICKKYGARTVMYGHAGDGNIHVRLILQKGKGTDCRMGRIAAEYFGMINAAGGTITGEHGDGLARSRFVPVQYGGRNMRQFARLKGLFDPLNIMNPGKIVVTCPRARPDI